MNKQLSIKITGISGYLGNLISYELIRKGHKVSGIERKLLYSNSSSLKNAIAGCDIIIHLAGATILQRWSVKNKKRIYDSRVLTTRNLMQAISELPKNKQPQKFISASAIGIYKAGALHDENSTDFDSGFVGKLVKDWEGELATLPEEIQQNIFRIGPVLGKNTKTIKNLITPFKLGIGGKIASGKQPFPFIHEKDLVKAFVWAIEEHCQSETFNLVAPESINNQNFTQTFSKQLNKPAFLPVPGFVLKLLFGKAAILLLEGPIVHPNALLNAGFHFNYPTIESALKEILT